MLELVDVGERTLESYSGVAPPDGVVHDPQPAAILPLHGKACRW